MLMWDLVKDKLINPTQAEAVSYCDSDNNPPISCKLTYEDVASISSSVCFLLERIHADGEVVCVHFDENNPEILLYVPVILAIIRTGCAFYFIRELDKVRQSADNCGSRLIISSHPLTSDHHMAANNIFISILPTIKQSNLPQDTCYLICTSGTTGSSKLVYVTNSSVVPNIIDMIKEFSVSSSDLLFLASPATFDPHIIDIFVSLSAGAKLLILPRTRLTRGDIVKDLFQTNRVTILQCTPSLLEMVMGKGCEVPSLRVVTVGGEKCREGALNILDKLWRQSVTIFHLYGLTEISVWQVMTKLDTAELLENPPVFVEGENLLSGVILDCGGQVGEIVLNSGNRRCWVEGNQVGVLNTGDIGHWNGSRLYWEGRKDDMVKIMGRKVFLAKVENVLSSKLSAAVVCVLGYDNTIEVFVKYDSTDHTYVDVLKVAKDNLASYEIPGRVTIVKQFPSTDNGKVDKRKLMNSSKPNLQPEKRHLLPLPTVDNLYALWTVAVGCPPSNSDNFVSSGGDSFSAVALVNSLRSQEEQPVPSTLLETLLRGTYGDVVKILLERRHSADTVIVKETTGQKSRLSAKKMKKEEQQTYLAISRLKGRTSCSEANHWPRWQTNTQARVIMSTAWSVDMQKCIDSSPLYLNMDGRKLLVACSHSGNVCCVQIASGKQVWRTTLSDRVEASPVADPAGKLLMVGCYDHNLYCLTVTTGEVVWVFPTGGLVKCSPLVTSEMVLFGSYDHRVYRVDTGSGEMLWRKEVSGSVLASPVEVENTLVITTLSGSVLAVQPGDGSTVWRTQLGHPVFGTPLYTGQEETGLLVPCVNRKLYSLSTTGTIMWTVSTGGPIFSSPIQVQDRVLFGCHDGLVYCVGGGGVVLWSSNVGGGVAGALDWNTRGDTVCCTVGGIVQLLNWNGDKIASIQLKGEVFSSPLMVEDRVVVGSRDNMLYCIEIATQPAGMESS